MESREIFALSALLFLMGFFFLWGAIIAYQKRDDQGYIEVAYRRTGGLGKGKVAAHSVFGLPVCFFFAGIGVGYWAWQLYQEGE